MPTSIRASHCSPRATGGPTISLAVPLSAAPEEVAARPIDSADPRDYQ
jgi:hypothetical protein